MTMAATVPEVLQGMKDLSTFIESPSFPHTIFGMSFCFAHTEDRRKKLLDQMRWFFIFVNQYKSFSAKTPLPKHIGDELGELVLDTSTGMLYYLLEITYMDATFPIRIAIKFYGAALDLRGGRRDVTIVMHELVPDDEQHPMSVFHENIVGYSHPCRTEQQTYDSLCEMFLHVKEMEKRNKDNRRRNRGRRGKRNR